MVLYGTRGILECGDPDVYAGEVRLLLPEAEPVRMPYTHGYNGVNMLPQKSPFDFYGHRGIGAADLAWAIRTGRKNRLSKEYGLHCQEILQGMSEAARTGQTYVPRSRCEVPPVKPGYFCSAGGGFARTDAERSLID